MLPDSTSALLLLSVLLVHSSVLSCLIGTQSECDVARFVPGHKMVGEGFDIVTLQRKRAHVIDVKTYLSPNGSCTLCSNPLQNHAYQKLPSSVVDWSASSQCSADIISSYHTSFSSLIKAYTSQDTNDWTDGLKVQMFELVGTTAYKFAKQQSKEDRYTLSTHSVTCNHYKFVLSPTPPLSAEFKRQLDILPSHYDSSTMNEYRDLINTYGTHYFRLVELGGRLRRLISSRSCLSTLNGLTSSEIHSCLSMGVAVGLGKLKISHVPKSCMGVLLNQDSATNFSSGLHQHHSEVLGGDGWLGEFSIYKNDSTAYMNWLKSLIEHPDVVSFSLRPLYQLVPNKLQQEGLKAAIEQYLNDTAVKKLPQEPHCETTTPNLSSDCCPLHASRGNLSVTIVRGWKLYGDVIGKTDGYAKMFYGSKSHKTQVIVSNDPQWNAEFDLGKVDTSLALKIEVWDQDLFYDDRLGRCEKYLIPGTHTFTCKATRGGIEVKYTLTCDPHLTGEKCSLYKPTPLVTGDW
ncbi:perforin-1-like [Xiphophorus maculatus]|uniref:perforin-1-like n=1 Tax=Xiphophorus maculatus TaxID=8083 RepID=UPI000C6D5A3E|nr:perforin-1-like [Xiphophorus maculatus]